jgi:hypothetical protein
MQPLRSEAGRRDAACRQPANREERCQQGQGRAGGCAFPDGFVRRGNVISAYWTEPVHGELPKWLAQNVAIGVG